MKKFLVIILIFITSCKHVTKVNGGHVQKRYTEFSVELPNENWLAQSYDGTDLFFEHKHKPASIFVSSQCEKISDSPLVALSAQLLVGFSDIKIVSQKNISLNEREALQPTKGFVQLGLDGRTISSSVSCPEIGLRKK